jgi:predicted HAD superfamily phosphohydrolase
MTITNFDVKQVLRTYHRQLAEKTRLSREKVYRKVIQQDSISISQESRRRLLTDRITEEIKKQFLTEPERNETMEAIVGQLSQEYGETLEVSTNDGQNLDFTVLSNGKEQGGKSLSPIENEELNKKFIDITKKIVYDNLV